MKGYILAYINQYISRTAGIFLIILTIALIKIIVFIVLVGQKLHDNREKGWLSFRSEIIAPLSVHITENEPLP